MKGAFVYIIASGTESQRKYDLPVKVGMTSNPIRRLSEIHHSSPFGAHVFNSFPIKNREKAFDIESTIQEDMRAFRLHGEWFQVDPFFAEDVISDLIGRFCR